MDTEQAVASLLREAEREHGEYETTTLGGVRDEAWAAWYARVLLDRGMANWLPGLNQAAPEQLETQLRLLDAEYDRDRPDAPWPDVYAARLVTEFGRST